MGYNHGKAVAEFRMKWRRLLRYYRDKGLAYEEILLEYKEDKKSLKDDRRYYEHIADGELDENDPALASEDDFTTYNEVNWINVLHEKLRVQIEILTKDHLRAFYLHRVVGYAEKEISTILHRPIQTISRWIVQIAEIIDNFC